MIALKKQNTVPVLARHNMFASVQSSEIAAFKSDIFDLLTKKNQGNLSRYLYAPSADVADTVNGLGLYDHLCSHQHYYLRNAEGSVIAENAKAMADIIGPGATVIELGPGPIGAVKRKTNVILQNLHEPEAYVGIDSCPVIATQAEALLRATYPEMPVKCFNTSFDSVSDISLSVTKPVFLCLGNTIGNFPKSNVVPNPYTVDFLKHIHKTIDKNGFLILGQDCNQNKQSLFDAYDNEDAKNWVTNLLDRMNRDAGVQIDKSTVKYYVEWNKDQYCLEMGVEITKDQAVVLDNIYFDLRAGQKLHLWNSFKYPPHVFQQLTELAGFETIKIFQDANGLSAVHVLKVRA